MNIHLSRRDFVVWLIVMIAVSTYAQIGTLTGHMDWEERFTPPFAYSPFRTDADHLGAEVYNVAESLYEKGSFADPFGDATGPTAWVAPLLPCLLAAGLLLTGGSKVAVTVGFFAMQCLVLATVATIVTGLAREWGATWAGVAAIAVTALIYFQYTFQITHDGVFAAGMLTMLVWGAVTWLGSTETGERPERRSLLRWGLVGGLAGLTSPILGLVWGALTLLRMPLRSTWLPISITLLIVSPWIVRNAMVFGKFIPTKSNAGFELYQALHDEPTGVVTRTSMNKHPYGQSNDHGRRYREIGEIAFADEKMTEFRSAFWENPMAYFDQVAARAEAAVWRLPNWLVAVEYSSWHRTIAWLYPLFFLGFLASWFAETPPGLDWLRCSQIAYVAFLTPYVMVSFYERYAVALWLPQAVFVAWLLCSGWRVLSGRVSTR